MIKEHSDLFSDSQCKICSAVLISESQKLTHYQVSEPTVCCCIQVSGTLQFFVVVVVLTMLICLVIKDLLVECTIHPLNRFVGTVLYFHQIKQVFQKINSKL